MQTYIIVFLNYMCAKTTTTIPFSLFHVFKVIDVKN